jgi:hypothetical protein
MVPICNNNVWRHRPTRRINSLNNGCLFPIVLLHYFRFYTLFKALNYYIPGNFPYHKACFVEIVDIRLLDAVFSHYIRNKPKPIRN